MSQERAFTLSQLQRRISALIASDPQLLGVWVTGETVDVRISGGHCYFELVEKDASGKAIARARATIWASTYYPLAAKFRAATGQDFRSDLKVMVWATAAYHPLYGFSLNITAINPTYTLGDAQQRRREMIERLTQEGVIDMNRTISWARVPQNIAVISARGAAGYGDFINQLYNNSSRLRFHIKLFSALMQGEKTAPSIISALDIISAHPENWDCVVIIRGGGSTSDLAAFDNYDLAYNIAQFPIPVIIGIGHERDITLLDYVANMRVKTPTAAAEWLIERGNQALATLQLIGSSMLQSITDRMAGCHRQLSFLQGQLPAIAQNAITKAANKLVSLQGGLASVSDRRIRPEMTRLDALSQSIIQAIKVTLSRQQQHLQNCHQLLNALSPEATLRRGYTITKVGGNAVGASQLRQGEIIETVFADGSAFSTINTIDIN